MLPVIHLSIVLLPQITIPLRFRGVELREIPVRVAMISYLSYPLAVRQTLCSSQVVPSAGARYQWRQHPCVSLLVV